MVVLIDMCVSAPKLAAYSSFNEVGTSFPVSVKQSDSSDGHFRSRANFLRELSQD